METQETRGCLIVCSRQPGATFGRFDQMRFAEEVCIPLLDILLTPEKPVDKVLILTRYATKGSDNSDVEVGARIPVPWETHGYVFTPTSIAVLKSLMSWIQMGRVTWLNDDSPSDDTSIERAVIFAHSQGCHSVIVPHGMPIPDSVAKLSALLRKAQSSGLALHYPSNPQSELVATQAV